MKIILQLLCLSIILSCGSSSKDKAESTNKTQPAISMVLPSIPEAELKDLFVNCDFVDYIFYELPFSMSYDNPTTIQSALQWVSTNSEIPTSGCKALGRMLFQSKGEQIMEAELYVSDSCGHYIWYKNGKKTYANKMTNTGHQHYMGIINQFKSK